MSQYLPEVAWSTLAGNVTLGATAYRYYVISCSGGAALSSSVKYLTNPKQKNKDGYYAIDQTLATSVYPDYTQGQVLMVKIVKTKV